jgi:parvulin-like peptidyl-prolyl isomerase
MKSQTARPAQRSKNQRPARSIKQNKYVKQTAHVEARRDGKPLIFGWGSHLSHNEKVKIQRRATWTAASAFMLLIVVVLAGFWININVITPGLPITTVNGHVITQAQYRKMVAFKTAFENNKINGPHGLITQRKNLETQVAQLQTSIDDDTKQINSLNAQIQKLPASATTQRSNLNAQVSGLQGRIVETQAKLTGLNHQLSTLTQASIPQEQQFFSQSQIGNDSATWLQEDEIIREWLATQNKTVQAKIDPSTSAINRAMNAFKADFPATSSYSHFLSQDNVSNDDIYAMMAIKLRRDNAQNYLASLKVSPAYQVLVRTMTIDTLAHARDILSQLHKGADFAKLAKSKVSVDSSTNTKGGDLGWLARGQYAQVEQSAIVENWLFDPARKLYEISPILTENSAYHIVQILNVDPARSVDSATLKTLKNNALSDWILIQRAILGSKITSPDQTRLFDPQNLPPDLPSASPGQAPGAPNVPNGGSLPTGP